jgi:hypothetical protein
MEGLSPSNIMGGVTFDAGRWHVKIRVPKKIIYYCKDYRKRQNEKKGMSEFQSILSNKPVSVIPKIFPIGTN